MSGPPKLSGSPFRQDIESQISVKVYNAIERKLDLLERTITVTYKNLATTEDDFIRETLSLATSIETMKTTKRAIDSLSGNVKTAAMEHYLETHSKTLACDVQTEARIDIYSARMKLHERRIDKDEEAYVNLLCVLANKYSNKY